MQGWRLRIFSVHCEQQQGDNLEQSWKNTIGTLNSAVAQMQMKGVALLGCRSGAPSNFAEKSAIYSADQPIPHAFTFSLGHQAATLNTVLKI